MDLDYVGVLWTCIAHFSLSVSFLQVNDSVTELLPVILGPLIDRFASKKTPFTLGLLVLIAATVMFFAGQHVVVLVVARALQGVSTTMVLTSGMTFLSLRLGSKNTGSAISVAMTGAVGGDLLGPAIGGLMYHASGEVGVFAVSAVVVSIDIVLRLLMLDPPSQPDDPKNEPLLAEERRREENEEESAGRQASPDLENNVVARDSSKRKLGYRSLLTNRSFLTSLWALWIGTSVRTGIETTVPLFIRSSFNWSESKGGLVMLIMLAPSIVSTLFARLKPRWPTALAFLVMGLLYIALSFVNGNTTSIKVVFGLIMFGIGVCYSLVTTVHMSAVSVIASERSEIRDGDDVRAVYTKMSRGKAFALMNSALAAGLLVGPVWAGSLDDRFGWLPMCISVAAVCVLSGGIVAFCWRGGK